MLPFNLGLEFFKMVVGRHLRFVFVHKFRLIGSQYDTDADVLTDLQ